jgi:hypothetical protein
MAKTKPDEEIRLLVKGELAAQFREYMAIHGHLSAPDAMREILSIYFASRPMDGVLRAARENVMNNLRHWMLTRMNISLKELQVELESQVAAIEQSGWGR